MINFLFRYRRTRVKMREQDILTVLKTLKFLPASLLNLILSNLTAVFKITDIKEFTLADVERTVNGSNKIVSCVALFLVGYEEDTKPTKLKVAMKFKDDALKSFSWSV